VDSPQVVIAGAGIIGLSLALDLATHGLRVTVLDRGSAMTEASWAAAGMLAANDPENPPQLAELALHSLSLYSDYLARIASLANRQVPLRTSTTLQASHPQRSFKPGEAAPHRRLSATEATALVPHLNPGARDFLLIEEQSLDPRDLCISFPLAAKAAGVVIRENHPVVSIDAEADGKITIQTPIEPITATHFVNCAGAWATFPALRANDRPSSHHPPVTPVKGQMVTVRLRGRDRLETVLRTPDIYLVPRGEARITIGATVEQAGFDKTVEPHAIARLLQAAAELYPPIADAEILETWAGLRPATADSLPLLGKASIQANYWIATGHYRNGILLAPGTARLLSQAIRGETPELDISAFAPNRTPL
jgi:glycine oxidase